jgi:hypothetical protein
MWRSRRSIYLEPGEVAALAEASRQASLHSKAHPRQGLLAAVAAALESFAAENGVLVTPAPAEVARQAARLHLRRHVAHPAVRLHDPPRTG